MSFYCCLCWFSYLFPLLGQNFNDRIASGKNKKLPRRQRKKKKMEQEKNEWCHGSLDLQYVHNLPEALHYKLTEWIIFQKKKSPVHFTAQRQRPKYGTERGWILFLYLLVHFCSNAFIVLWIDEKRERLENAGCAFPVSKYFLSFCVK